MPTTFSYYSLRERCAFPGVSRNLLHGCGALAGFFLFTCVYVWGGVWCLSWLPALESAQLRAYEERWELHALQSRWEEDRWRPVAEFVRKACGSAPAQFAAVDCASAVSLATEPVVGASSLPHTALWNRTVALALGGDEHVGSGAGLVLFTLQWVMHHGKMLFVLSGW